MKWKCSNNICIASILTDSEIKILIQRLGKHKHSDFPVSTIERQIIRENCKRKTVDSISTKPNKIIRTELLTDNYLTLQLFRKVYTPKEENTIHHCLSHVLMKHILLNLRKIKIKTV